MNMNCLYLWKRSDKRIRNCISKYQEVHYQKAYTLEKIKTLLEKAGLSYLGAYDAYTQDAPLYTSQRICVVAQECQKMVR